MFCPQCGASVPEGATYCARCGAAQSPSSQAPATAHVAAPAPAAPAAGFVYAGFWRRFAAYFLDGLILMVVTIPVGFLTGFPFLGFGFRDPGDLDPEAFAAMIGAVLIGNGISFVVGGAYFAMMESSSRQATLGKMALGLRVTDVAGRRISLGRAAGRYVAHLLSNVTLLIGYLMMLFTERRQALHDMVAGTVVVRG